MNTIRKNGKDNSNRYVCALNIENETKCINFSNRLTKLMVDDRIYMEVSLWVIL